MIADDEARAVVLNLPWRREAAVRHMALAVEHVMNIYKADRKGGSADLDLDESLSSLACRGSHGCENGRR